MYMEILYKDVIIKKSIYQVILVHEHWSVLYEV